jgi:hypothetical protein
MANWKIKVPQGTYKSDRTISQSIAELQKAKTASGKELKEISEFYSLPFYLVFAVATLESGGQSIRSFDGLSYGVMQTNAETMDGVIKEVFKQGMTMGKFYPLYLDIKPLFTLKKPIPANFWDNSNIALRQEPASNFLRYKGWEAWKSTKSTYNQKMMTNKPFAIRVGVLFLRQLIGDSLEKVGQDVYLRMDWVIKGYNMGYYSLKFGILNKPQNRALDSNALIIRPDLINQRYTKPYIQRIGGINGYLDLIKQGKFKLS